MSDASADNGDIGLFIVAYEIGTGLLGAPGLVVHLAVNTPAETIGGQARLTQAVNPPLNIDVQLSGDFTYMTVMPDNTHILVVLSSVTPNLNGQGLELRMVLTNWTSGTANYKYSKELPGNWTSVTDVPVRLIEPAGAPSAPEAVTA
jgi:hypothetical protein